MEISNIYKSFAEKFPSHRDLWNSLANEEVNHAAYVKNLSSLAKEGKVYFDEKTTTTYTVKTIIADLKNRYQNTSSNQYTLLKALSYSLSLENSVIESKFYDFFSSDDQHIISIINTIKQETYQHAAKIKKAMEEEKKHAK